MSQGVPWNKKEVIDALSHYLRLGYSVNRACELVEIPQSTVATWVSDDVALRLKIKAWQGSVSSKAREIVAKSIADGNKDDARWWLERREKKDFSTRQEVTGSDGEDIGVLVKRLETDYDQLGKQASGQMVEDEPPVQDQEQAGATGDVPSQPDTASTHVGEGGPPPEPDSQG